MKLELLDCIRIIYDAHSCMEEGYPYDTELVQRALEEIGGSTCKYSEYIEQKCKEVEERLAEDLKHVKHVRPFMTIHYDGKPTSSGMYLIKLAYNDKWTLLMYSAKFEKWNAYDDMPKYYEEERTFPEELIEAWVEFDEIDGKGSTSMTFEELQAVNNELRTTNIKGKEYAEVNQRILGFRKLHPNGCITSEIVSLENGICVIKAVVTDADGHILGTGHAYEKEGSTFINKTSYIENCVPLSTQILTNNGWKYYYQLSEKDLALTLNIDTKKMEFSKITAINIYKDKQILELSTSRFKVRCTSQHKWIVRTQYKDLHKVATEDLGVTHKIIQAVKQSTTPSAIGRKLGWLMCDCDMNMSEDGMASTGYIRQSKYIDEIEELFGEGKLRKKYNDAWMDNYEWVIPAEEVRNILGHFGMANYKDLAGAMVKADINDVAGCFESMMLADGGSRGFTSTYYELIEAIQIMCARLGIATTFVTDAMKKNATKPIYTIGIKKTDGAWFSEMEIKNLPPQDVWCPTTETGTWIMRQGTFVTLTSNCETSAIGRALGMCGIGIDTAVASYEEISNAIANQENSKDLMKELQWLVRELAKVNVDVRDDENIHSYVLEKAKVQNLDAAVLSDVPAEAKRVIEVYKKLLDAKKKKDKENEVNPTN